MRDIQAAIVQLRATPDVRATVAVATALSARARADGAAFVALPENFWGIGDEGLGRELARPLSEADASPIVAPLLDLSRRHPGAWIVLGGLPERPAPEDPAAAQGLVYNTLALVEGGEIRASYRKIHRFDADLADGSVLRESARVAGGRRPVVALTPVGAIGLSICYDLRFPALYRALALAGAEIIVAPAAFTLHTGLDHWEVLVRARALDTQSYVLAPAVWGRHNERRHSFGHSMIVDPWGTVIAQASPTDTVRQARLDPALLAQVRSDLPVLRHQVLPEPPPADIIDLRGV